ncbi:tyrosine-type recombinase/integrase [Phytopseudomonas dryadis]|uniref:Integrase n=1 Tax=Phytopseudomonas dryadis TaxID=2487520 RepID=A0A4Q9QW92_9GAMM|nr:integrase arm-type DNA-binding domain-containing protein [Pseudomonas dryadis]TBU88469.1 integrase [Pseudomonas dryadis]
MALTDLIVRQAKATGKAYTIPDSDGLALAVSPIGSKSWHFRYSWVGKQKRMSLGTYPEVGLREARTLRDQARALLAKGVNPKLDRKQRRRAVRLANDHVFKAVFLQWVKHRRLELNEGRNSTLSQILRIFERDVLPSLGNMPIYHIRRSDLLDVISKIEDRGALSTAGKVRTWLNQLFRYALVLVDGLETNPASDLDVVAVPEPPVTNNPFLRMPELPALLQKVRRYRGAITTQLGIRLLLLTGVRTGELRLATPDQFDLDQGLWIIPPEVVKQLQNDMRKKGKRPQSIPPYIVPLSVQAIEIVRYLLEQVKPAQRYLLAHRSELKKRISENTLNGALTRMGYKDLLTGHGIRATISTALNEVGYLKTWVDAQLSHRDPNQVSAAYNHAMYVEPRRKMMQDWADRLDLLERGEVAAASAHLTIRIDGVPVLDEGHGPWVDQGETTTPAVLRVMAGAPVHRLSAVPARPVPSPVVEVAISDRQRERMEMLATYEAPHNLPVAQFAKLAGKSKDQINREIKAGKLLTISIGNRGQRIPEWQLDPLRQRLVQSAMARIEGVDPWQLYRALVQPRESLGGSAIEIVSAANVHEAIAAVCNELMNRKEPRPQAV